jgi:hypothetical protein
MNRQKSSNGDLWKPEGKEVERTRKQNSRFGFRSMADGIFEDKKKKKSGGAWMRGLEDVVCIRGIAFGSKKGF